MARLGQGVERAVGGVRLGSIEATHLGWAILLGTLSAISLPLGSAVGLTLRPGPTLTGTLAAFGAGALIAALSVEIVAPVVEAFRHDPTSRDALLTLMVGAGTGGVLFVVLDQLVNARGGFLRKTATTIGHLRQTKRQRTREILADLSRVDLLRNVPADEIGEHVEDLKTVVFQGGELLFREGERGGTMFFLRRGHVQLDHGGEPVATLGPGDTVGEISLLSHGPRTATGRARGRVEALALHPQDFDRWRQESPELDAAVRALAHARLSQLREHDAERHAHAERWLDEAIDALRFGTELPTAAEIREAAEDRGGAPLAIWLGILLDGLSESILIGDSFHARLQGAPGAPVSSNSCPTRSWRACSSRTSPRRCRVRWACAARGWVAAASSSCERPWWSSLGSAPASASASASRSPRPRRRASRAWRRAPCSR